MPIKIGDKTYKPHQISEVRIGTDLYYQSALPKREISYYGTATDMSSVRCDYYLAGVSFNGYAVFGGGVINSSFGGTNLVDAYDSNLTLHKLTDFTTARGSNPAGATQHYCIFAGGRNGIKSAEAYNTDLTKVSSVPDLAYSRYDSSTVSVGNYLVIAGGEPTSNVQNSAEGYDDNLTKVSVPSIYSKMWQFGDSGTTLGNYGIIAGGYYATGSSAIRSNFAFAYDNNLTKTDLSNLTVGANGIMSASTDTYAFFAGGEKSGGKTDIVNVYDKNLTKQSDLQLSTARHAGTGVGVRDYVLIAGGHATSNVVDIYDNDLVRTTGHTLSTARYSLASATTGDYLLIAGGQFYKTVDVYEAS